jgi:hypothetical protein
LRALCNVVAGPLNLHHPERDQDADPNVRAEKTAWLDQASVGNVNALATVLP